MEIKEDSMFNGQIICRQYVEGYRYSIDALLLTYFAKIKNGERILDMGSGCGIIMLILHYLYGSKISCCGIEIQPELATLSAENLALNGILWKVDNADIRQINNNTYQKFDKILCNPPFYRTKDGRSNKNLQAHYARHQEHGELLDFLQSAYNLLIDRGSAFFVYPAEQCCDFITTARKAKMEVKQLRFVHGYPGLEARLALFSCTKNGRPSSLVQSPLYIYKEKNGKYSDEVTQYYQIK